MKSTSNVGGIDKPPGVFLLLLFLCIFCTYFLLQGIMGILSGSLGQEFFEFCYNPVGEVSFVRSIALDGGRNRFQHHFVLKPVFPFF